MKDRTKFRVLVACEESDEVRSKFERNGYDAWSCDILPNRNPQAKHYQCDVRDILNDGWDLMIAFPPCTHLAVSGARYFEEKIADGRQQKAIDFFMCLVNAKIPIIAIENPVGIMSTHYRKPDQIIQPYEYGHAEAKKTCLWLKGLPKLVPTHIVKKPACGHWKNQTQTGQNKIVVNGKWISYRDKRTQQIRSKTYKGIAEAMANQWNIKSPKIQIKQNLDSIMNQDHIDFISEIERDIREGKKHNKTSIEKMAAKYGIVSKNDAKELTELAIVNWAKKVVRMTKGVADTFYKIVELYKSQVNLSHRTSQSILLQQYSTPAPLGYLMGMFCRIDRLKFPNTAFEPSAGNGLLTIAGNPACFIVNELDGFRNSNLQTQGFAKVTRQNATVPFSDYYHKFEAVLTNPPFGTLNDAVRFGQYEIKTLDHLMAIRALDTMKDNGHCAIIIGGHTDWDEKGRIQKGKNRMFFSYLYEHYHVLDVINVDGDLYSKQGTSFNVRMILIDGRKETPEGYAPLKNLGDEVVTDFDTLYQRVIRFVDVIRADANRGVLIQRQEHEDKYGKPLSEFEILNNTHYLNRIKRKEITAQTALVYLKQIGVRPERKIKEMAASEVAVSDKNRSLNLIKLKAKALKLKLTLLHL